MMQTKLSLRRACSSGKVIHKSEGSALDSIMRQVEWRDAPKLRAYQCMECYGWHLTKSEKRA